MRGTDVTHSVQACHVHHPSRPDRIPIGGAAARAASTPGMSAIDSIVWGMGVGALRRGGDEIPALLLSVALLCSSRLFLERRRRYHRRLMPKSVRRAGGRRANALRSRTPQTDPRSLLDRILDTPHLAHAVPRLQPEVLHRVIQRCGLEDCGELIALTTPEQLARVLDLDLWRSEPGLDEQFDARRFGLWLEVLMESGAAVAAQKLAEIDVDLVSAGLAPHVRVFDRAAVSSLTTDDEEAEARRSLSDGLGCEVGGYLVLARDTDSTVSWDAIAGALSLLEATHRNFFHRVMRGCRTLSNAGFELDGLDDLAPAPEQVLFDLAVSRERRQEQQGYVTPAQARAFLQSSRQLPLGDAAAPTGDPIARAYFRAIEWTPPAAEPPLPRDSAGAVAAMVDVLLEAGVIAQPARALLEGASGDAPRLARIQAHMQVARDRDPDAFLMRSQELAYLANTIVAGCSIQARPFTEQEASDASVAVCNLGLENWPRQWLPADDLIGVFQVGWTVLHDDVTMYAATQLISVLTRLRCDDRETQIGLNALRREMTKQCQAGAPWRARDALDVLSTLDMPAWAALLGLIDECPVIHAAMSAGIPGTRAVSPSAFEFISENSQIAAVRGFMQSLPGALRR